MILPEAFDVGSMASRGLSGRAIIIDPSEVAKDDQHIVVVSTTQKQPTECIDKDTGDTRTVFIQKTMGFAAATRTTIKHSQRDAHDPRYVWQITTLYADDPITALMLLGTALHVWRAVIPDSFTSPAASALIKRYYDENKNDKNLIRRLTKHEHNDDLDERGNHLNAIYMGPIAGFDPGAAIRLGDNIVKSSVKKSGVMTSKKWVYTTYIVDASHGFDLAFRDPVKTKSMDELMKFSEMEAVVKNPDQSYHPSSRIIDTLLTMIHSTNESLRKQAIEFVDEHIHDLDRLFSGWGFYLEFRDTYEQLKHQNNIG